MTDNKTEKRDVMIQINEKENIDFLPLNTLMPQGDYEVEKSWEKELVLPITFAGIWTRDIGKEAWNFLVKNNGNTYKILQVLTGTMGRQITEQMVSFLKISKPEIYAKSSLVNAHDLVEDFSKLDGTFALMMTWKLGNNGYYYRQITILESVVSSEE
tara:strand:- start:790 stop:1260 length:471 start_codon:yes stop_codon:yes gene_type:complete